METNILLKPEGIMKRNRIKKSFTVFQSRAPFSRYRGFYFRSPRLPARAIQTSHHTTFGYPLAVRLLLQWQMDGEENDDELPKVIRFTVKTVRNILACVHVPTDSAGDSIAGRVNKTWCLAGEHVPVRGQRANES